MPHFELRKHTTNELIYNGNYSSFTQCLENAVKHNIDLSHINLCGKNLTNANLDNATMPCAIFNNSNLTGANLSEANLRDASFKNCPLFNTCFAYSSMENCDFTGAEFGATHISGAVITGSTFSTLSCFELELPLTQNMTGCLYIMPDGSSHLMSAPPIVVKGVLNTPVVMLDRVIKIGEKTFPKLLLPKILHMLSLHDHRANDTNLKYLGEIH